jgi:hypothetical protein
MANHWANRFANARRPMPLEANPLVHRGGRLEQAAQLMAPPAQLAAAVRPLPERAALLGEVIRQQVRARFRRP